MGPGAKPVKVGIIGAGRIAVDSHVPDLRRAGAAVVALADVVPGRAKRYADALGVPHAFDDYRRMLAMEDLEAVSVASPVFAHEENAVAAFEAGKHVFLEKPPAPSADAMQRIAEAGRRAGRLLLVGSQSVYHHEMQVLRRAIERGDLGRIYFVHVRVCERWGHPHGWLRLKRFAGGGAGMDGNSHVLDRLLFLLGTPRPVSITARTYNAFPREPSTSPYLPMDFAEGRESDPPEKDVEDTAVYLAQFAGGCSALVECTKTAHQADSGGLWVYGERGGASLSPLTFYGQAADGTLTTTTVRPAREKQTHEQAFRHFVQCIREGRPQTDSPGERAVVVMRIIGAMYESAAAGGREVRFD
jgi:predicted dehydrogenase